MEAILLPVVIITAVGILSGVVLTVAAKYMAVPVDDRVERVRALLPGANCGTCGFAGCDEYAEKLVKEEGTKSNLCIPGGEGVSKRISEALGVAFEEVVPMYAIMRCSGRLGKTDYIMDYQGPQTCEACNFFYQGRGSCSHACLGFGDCVKVCQYDAIYIQNGIAAIDDELCTGCGMCAKSCPNHLIDLVPKSSKVYVGCHSTDKGAFTRKVCQAGCIGCKKCEKTCEYGAITIEDNLARIDPEKCTNCGACVGVCPTGVIQSRAGAPAEQAS